MDMVKLLLSLMGGNRSGGGMMGTVAKAAIPMILMGLFKNVMNNKGAESLTKALGDHEKDGGDDVFSRVQQSDTQDGMKILKHIFGKDTDDLTSQIANKAGVSQNEAQDAMGSLAPVIMEMLANKTKGNRSVDGVRSTIADELKKVDSDPQAPDLPDVIRDVLAGGGMPQTQQKSQGGLGGLLGSLLGGGQEEDDSAGGLMDLLGGTEGIGNILKKMM